MPIFPSGAPGPTGPAGPPGPPGGAWTITAVKTANYNAVVSDLVRVDPSGGAFTITLPDAVTSGAGSSVIVKNVTSSPLPVLTAPTGADTIDGAASYSFSTGLGSLTFVSDGIANWMVV